MPRVDAYIETIRRERTNKDLLAMSDTELPGLPHSGRAICVPPLSARAGHCSALPELRGIDVGRLKVE